MPKNIQPPQFYKTESQLKEEALAKRAAEAKASAASPKSELRKKRENFWYHYKWHTVACAFGIFLLVFFVKDIFLRAKPDATIIIISERFFDDNERASLTGMIEAVSVDYNGDGKIVVLSDFISLPRDVDEDGPSDAPGFTGGQQEMASAMKMMAVISAATDPIYLLDSAAYGRIMAIGSDEETKSEVFDDYSVPVRNLKGEDVSGFDGMRFYLRTARAGEAYYEYCMGLLKNIDRSWNNAPG